MDDPELQAIRNARMQQMQGQMVRNLKFLLKFPNDE
jgi:DNA-binding TFAR19-related protein (PDSD5 family)